MRGNWVAAIATAAVTLGVAVLCALIFAVVLDINGVDDLATEIGAWDIAVGIVTLALSSLSIDVVAGASGGSTEMSGNAGVVPLLITLLSLGAAVGTFRRLQRTCSRVGPALGDAARAAMLVGLAVLVLSLVFRTGLDEQRDRFNELGFVPPISDLGLGPSRGSALVLPMLVLFGVLALACVVRGDWLGPRLRRVHDVVASPVEALGLLVALLPLLGLAGYAALLTSGDFRAGLDEASAEGGWRRVLVVMTLAVSNVGAAFLGIGAGGRLGGRAEASFGSEPGEGLSEFTSWWGRLARLADETDAWGLWFAIPVTLVVLGLLAWFVVRRSAQRGRHPLGSLLVWCGLLFLTLPVLARLASLHAAGEADWEFAGETGELVGRAFLGLPSVDALLLALVGAVLALLVALLTGLLDLRGAAARMRTTYPQGGYPPPPPGRRPPQQP